MAKMASVIHVPFGRRCSYDMAAFLCPLCRRYFRRGVLREEDGWVREEEDRTIRCKEVSVDGHAKMRTQEPSQPRGHAKLRIQEPSQPPATSPTRVSRVTWGPSQVVQIPQRIPQKIPPKDPTRMSKGSHKESTNDWIRLRK